MTNTADVSTISSMPGAPLDLVNFLHGRRQIYTSEKEITRDNVIKVLTKALAVHEMNRQEILFLLDYEKGIQPILYRSKKYNGDVCCNRVVENIASSITAFKEAEFAGEPIKYVSRRGNNAVDDENKEIPEKVAQVNDMMLSEGKESLDIQLAHKMFICGVGYRLVYNDEDDAGLEDYLDEAPFEISIPDVENTFVVKRRDAKKKVVMGVTYVYKDEPENSVEYTVYTPKVTYTIEGIAGSKDGEGLTITDEVHHNFGQISLIEYPCNPDYMGAFEVVLPLLDAINLTQSNRLDGIEQFIQALMVFDGIDIEREDFLKLKDQGAIVLPPSQGGNGGHKLYYLNEQLDQTQTQTLVNDMKKAVLEIVGMPSQGDANTGDSSNNGAMIMKNGWWHAEGRAKQSQNMWKKAETDFLKVVLKMCADSNKLTGLKISDLEPKFWRQSYEDLLVKTQSFQNLRTAGCSSIQAFRYSHLSPDPESDAIAYDEYQEKLAEALREMNAQQNDVPLKEDGTTDPTSPRGIEAQSESNASGGGGGKKGDWAKCPVCGKTFQKKNANQKYDSVSCANKARGSNGINWGR